MQTQATLLAQTREAFQTCRKGQTVQSKNPLLDQSLQVFRTRKKGQVNEP